jgi:hypothetical protein
MWLVNKWKFKEKTCFLYNKIKWKQTDNFVDNLFNLTRLGVTLKVLKVWLLFACLVRGAQWAAVLRYHRQKTADLFLATMVYISLLQGIWCGLGYMAVGIWSSNRAELSWAELRRWAHTTAAAATTSAAAPTATVVATASATTAGIATSTAAATAATARTVAVVAVAAVDVVIVMAVVHSTQVLTYIHVVANDLKTTNALLLVKEEADTK